VRVATPYSSYQDFDFIIPIGTAGDTYDRFMVRQEEMWQSLKIIEQAIKICQRISRFMPIFLNFIYRQKKKFTIIWSAYLSL